MKKTIIAAFALGLFAAASANAVSWDCTKARSYSEKLKRTTGNSAVFKKFQNENWKRREECRSIGCVVDWYQTSEAYYSEIIRRATGGASARGQAGRP